MCDSVRMTKLYSTPGDNGGRCEVCNEPGSEYRSQTTVPVQLAGFGPGGGGPAWGTMWCCDACAAKRAAPAGAPSIAPAAR